MTEGTEEVARRRSPRRVVPPFSGTRARILVTFAALMVASTAASLLLLNEILSSRLDEEIADELAQEVREFRRLVGGNDPRTGEPFGTDVERIFDAYFARNVPDEGEVLIGAVGRRLYRSARAGDGGYRPRELLRAIAREHGLERSGSGSVETAAGSARFLSVPIQAGDRILGTFVVANFPAHEQREIRDALVVSAQVSGVVLLAAFLAAWLSAGRVLAPLRLLRDTAQSITETDLTRRIAVTGDDEVAQLARTFNQMLDRLEAGFSTQRQFLDDVGHELRTPITIVRGHLELLSHDPEDREETLALVTDELDRMARLVNDLLLLARAQRPDFLELEEVDVEALTAELQTKAEALAPRQWRLESRGRGRIVGDRQRLTQAVMQLVDNAVKHTRDEDVIAIGAFVVDGEAHLFVRDTGPGIAYEEQEAIFERLARGTGARRGEGLGLGLSIVQTIARAHGGRVELRSRPGAGATFTVVVPVDGPRRGRR